MVKRLSIFGIIFLLGSMPFVGRTAITSPPVGLDDSLLATFALGDFDARDEFNRPVQNSARFFDPGQTLKVLRLVLGTQPFLFRLRVATEALYFSDQPVLPPLAAVEFNLPQKGWPIRSISLLLPGNGRDRFSLNSSVSRIDSAIISSAERIPTDLPSSDSPQKFEVLRL